MDTAKAIKHGLRLTVLAVILVACAWLIPSQLGLAASSHDNFDVHVMVLDSVGSRIGNPALSDAALDANQAITHDVSRVTADAAGNTAHDNEIVVTTIKF